MRFSRPIYKSIALGSVYLTSMGVCECGQKACRTENIHKVALSCKYNKEHSLTNLSQNTQAVIFKKRMFHDNDFAIQLDISNFSISGSLIEPQKIDEETYTRLKIEEATPLSDASKAKIESQFSEILLADPEKDCVSSKSAGAIVDDYTYRINIDERLYLVSDLIIFDTMMDAFKEASPASEKVKWNGTDYEVLPSY